MAVLRYAFVYLIALLCGIADSWDQFVAACRASCIDEFANRLPSIPTDHGCQQNSHCQQCWVSCRQLHTNYQLWGAMCSQRQLCFRGCQIACQFHKTYKRGTAREMSRDSHLDDDWTMDVFRDRESGELHVSWMPIGGFSTRPLQRPAVVYVLHWREGDTAKWQDLTQTVETSYWTRNAEITLNVTEFRLIAVNTTGIIAYKHWTDPVSVHSVTTSKFSKPPKKIVPITRNPDLKSVDVYSTTVFVASVTVCSFLIGLVLTLSVVLTKILVRKLKKRRQLARGLAVRHAMTVGHIRSAVHV